MHKISIKKTGLFLLGIIVIGIIIYTYPPVHQRLSWRFDFLMTYLRGVVYPVEAIPTSLPPPAVAVTPLKSDTPVSTPTSTNTPGPTPTATQTPTPIADIVTLTAPTYEKQDINNCGPASLAMYLRYWGWEGDQFDIAELLKPKREDRNVNVEELEYYVRTQAGWLNVIYRVGGNIELLKQLIAAGIPVMVEESFYFEAPYWPNDDLWAAHYNLLTGYNKQSQTFIGQDSFHGANQEISFDTLEEYWQVFNYVYLVAYPPNYEESVKTILGSNWDIESNRNHALSISQSNVSKNPENTFSWFNLGANLVYFERYSEAAQAFDQARQLGFPQRMLRYQFSPFFAYFHSGRITDLMTLTEYALKRTPNSEEALLWYGWGLYRQGDTRGAISNFQAALSENPNYKDAQYALDFIMGNK